MKKLSPESAGWDLLLGIIWTVIATIYGYEYFGLHKYGSWIVTLPSAVGALIFYGLAIYKFIHKRKQKNTY